LHVINAEIAAVFDEIADLLEIEEANPFRIRAYRNAARRLEDLGRSVASMVDGGEDLTAIPGIGADLAGKIAEVVHTGTCELRERLRREVPPAVTELLKIPGLGPKRVRALYHELDVHTLEQLERAARDGRIRGLHGFGEKTERRILEAIGAHAGKSTRFKLAHAAQAADELVTHLRGAPGVDRVEVAGSLRRMRETVGDLDVLVTGGDPAAVVAHFAKYDAIVRMLSSGRTRASAVLRTGMQVDLRVVDAKCYGSALVYFTGSKAHNIAIRRLAQQRGLKINEYGVFRDGRRVAGETEASVYRALGLPEIPPELREDRGEVEAARENRLPELVELADLRGDLHMHTKATDGQATIREMALAAKAMGLEYIAITEHSKRLAMAHGLDAQRLAKQIDEIDRVNASLEGITVLKGIEVDILDDGRLDLPDAVLARLDLVIGAVHSRFELSRDRQTERVLRAFDNPLLTMLAHPSGRLIGEREPYDIDMARVIRAAAERGVCLELNAHPSRLDLLDTWCMQARSQAVLVSVNSDAHSTFELANLRFGIGQARRGWLGRRDVLNTRTLARLRALLARRRSGGSAPTAKAGR